MFRPVRISPPTELPISVEDAKAFLRVDGADDDELIEALIGAALDHLDGRAGILGRCLMTQTWRYRLASFRRSIDLDMPGATAAVLRYANRDGVQQTVDASDVTLVETVRGSVIVVADSVNGADWFGPFEADVTFGTQPLLLPPAIVQAIRILVAHWYSNREVIVPGAVSEVPMSVRALISPYRWMSI